MAIIKVDKRKTESSLKTALIAFAIEFSNKMADAAPADEGNLRRRIREGWKVKKIGDEWHITFSMPDYAPHVEFGTRPHKIRAKGGPDGADFLAFEPGRKGRLEAGKSLKKGAIIFRKEVQHPGTSAQPFIRPTFHQHAIPLMVKNLRRFFK